MTDSLATAKDAIFSAQQKADIGDMKATDSAREYLAHKAALQEVNGTTLDMDFTTTANVIYTQIKVSDTVNYIKKMDTVNGTLTYSANNTAWANRASATYTTRAV